MLIIRNSKAIEASIDMMEVRQILGIRMFADAVKRMLQVWLLARLIHHKDQSSGFFVLLAQVINHYDFENH